MKYLKWFGYTFLLLASLFLLVCVQILWAKEFDLSLTLTEGTLSIDIVDAAGDPATNLDYLFTEKAFSFDAQDFSGTLGTTTQKIRLSNPTVTNIYNVSVAATNVANVWTDGTYTFAYNATNADDGRLTVNPTAGTITGVNGCSIAEISKGSSAYFLTTVTNSIDLMTAGVGTEVGCRWDLTGVGLTQRLPAAQPPSTYSIDMILSAV